MIEELGKIIKIREARHSTTPIGPYAVYNCEISNLIYDEVYITKNDVELDVYMNVIDKNLLEEIESVFKNRNISYEKQPIEWLSSEKSYLVSYDFLFYEKGEIYEKK